MTSDRWRRQLRWYPTAWRDRYGAELAALLEDTYGSGPIPVGEQLSLARRGLGERLRAAGLNGRGPADRVARTGALLVLCAWAPFVVTGSAFAKYVEHWDAFTAPSAQWLPGAAVAATQVAAAVGALVVAIGALAVGPAARRFLRAGGWPQVRVAVLAATGAGTLTVALTAAMVLWAHGMSATGRNGGSSIYSAVGLVWVACFAGTVVLGAAAAVAVTRRLELTRRIVRLEAGLALVLIGAMAVVTTGTVVWWATMAVDAPGFLDQGVLGAWAGVAPPVLLGTTLCMLLGLAGAVHGGRLVVTGLRAPGSPARPSR